MDTMERIESLSKGVEDVKWKPDEDFKIDTITQTENSKAGANNRSEREEKTNGSCRGQCNHTC